MAPQGTTGQRGSATREGDGFDERLGPVAEPGELAQHCS
jgi:hypothetical protein